MPGGGASSTDAIDLTTEGAASDAANVTPERPAKRFRVSRRLEALRAQEEEIAAAAEKKKKTRRRRGKNGKEDLVEEDDEDYDAPHYEAEDSRRDGDKRDTNGYFEVDEILDRRTRKYGSESAGLRHVVEYLVSWKKPPDHDDATGGEEETADDDYEPSWLIAENLDQNSLVDAFRKFPTDADPKRSKGSKNAKTKPAKIDEDREVDFSDDEDDEESDEEEEYEEEEDVEKSSSDDMQEYDEEDGDKSASVVVKDREVSHLEDSDYDSPGTVELVLNRRTYRVGQSYYVGPGEDVVFTISMILPVPRKATCHKYVRIEKTFVCPEGSEGSYALASEDVTLDLSCLKLPCSVAFEKFPMRYEQEDERQRSFSYYNETGKILHHPAGRPAVLDLFAGAGGMGLGLGKYFDVKWVVDNDHLASATLRANKGNSDAARIYVEDVKTFLKKSVRGDPCYPAVGRVDHIHASPPCKGFSRANRNGGKDDMQNNKQTLYFIKAIRHFRPKTATFENVPGLVLDEYKGYLRSVVAGLLRMGYQVRGKVLTSSLYGDPQKRRRLILVAARGDCALPAMPVPTHGPGLLPIMTSRDALRILEGHDPAVSSSRSASPSGAVLVDGVVVFNHVVPPSSGRRKREDDNAQEEYELIEDEPSRTVLARSRPHVHYRGDRFISVREAACLQSFPLSHQFFGRMSHQYSQVGNAVPVKLATAVARSVAVVHGCAT